MQSNNEMNETEEKIAKKFTKHKWISYSIELYFRNAQRFKAELVQAFCAKEKVYQLSAFFANKLNETSSFTVWDTVVRRQKL